MSKYKARSGRRLAGSMWAAAEQRIVAYLTNHGPIVDEDGRAGVILREAVRWKGTPTAFTGLLGTLGAEGVLIRDAHPGRGTFKIALAGPEVVIDLTDQSQPEPEPGPGVDDVAEVYAPSAADIGALAAAVLDRALAARAEAAKAEETALEAMVRAEEAEERLRSLEGAAESLLDIQAQLGAVVAELDAERRRATHAEEAAAAFRTRCEELDAQVGKLRKALAASEGELRKKRIENGFPFRDHLRPESQAELDRMMKESPVWRG